VAGQPPVIVVQDGHEGALGPLEQPEQMRLGATLWLLSNVHQGWVSKVAHHLG